MLTRLTIVLLTLGGALAIAAASVKSAAPDPARQVTIVRHDDAKRIDVLVGGKPFTSYIYPASTRKPVLYPLRSAKGTIVTRGYPLEPRAGERADHMHHVGFWFTHGDLNGIDFWGYSDETPAKEIPTKGTIQHRAVTRSENGDGRGELAITADWVMPDGSTILTEETRFTFRAAADSRVVDRITRWTARDKKIAFGDTKEGSFGLRVARSLEQPSKEAEIFTDASGQKTTVPKLDNTGVTGLYRSSEGQTGDAVWGTRGRWLMLTGTVDREPVTLAIVDHPKNPGAPTYWHARGYGLFTANPFGQHAFDSKQPTRTVVLEPRQSMMFRHRLLILSGTATPQRIDEEFKAFERIPE